MKRLFFLFALFCFSNPTIAQSMLPLEAYGALPEVSMVSIAPGGDRIAYRKTTADQDVVIIYSFKKQQVIGGVNVAEIRPAHIYFVNEDTLILVASKNTRISGFIGRYATSVAYSYRISKQEIAQLLIAGEGIYKGNTSLGRVVGISDDGKYAYMPAWSEKTRYSLLKVKLKGKSKPRPVKRGTYDAIDYFIHNDEMVARVLFDNEEDLFRVESMIDDEWKEIYRESTEIPTRSFVGLTADLKSLVMKAYSSNDRVAYYTMSLQDGAVSDPVFNPEDKDIEWVINDINRVVHGVRYSGFRPSYDFFDEKLDKIVKEVMAKLPDDSVFLESYTDDFSHLVFRVEGVNSSGSYYLYHNGEFKFITASRPLVTADKIAYVSQTKIKARDGLYIPTLLTLPFVEELKNLPGIILPHGGPESYDKIGFDWWAQYFASRGYIVMQPQFRGSDGFGWDFKQKGRGEWGRKMQDDLTDTVKTMVKSGYLDPERVCIVGGSYGGYAALAGATFTPDVYKCAISVNGVADLDQMMTDERRDAGSDHWVVAYWNKVISSGNLDANHLEQISPINHIDKVKIPVLLIHGTHDEVVPAHQSASMFRALKNADKSVQYVELKKGDHYLSNGANRMQALQAMDEFIKKHL